MIDFIGREICFRFSKYRFKFFVHFRISDPRQTDKAVHGKSNAGYCGGGSRSRHPQRRC